MRAPGDDVGALGERLLEGAVEPEDVGHVVHEHRFFRPALDDPGHEAHGLGVDEHAFAEDDELGPRLPEDFGEFGEVGFIGIVLQDGEVNDPLLPRGRVLVHEVEQGAHRLGAQMPAHAEVVVHDQAHPPEGNARGPFPVDELDDALEDDLVGHLPADRPKLDVLAPEEGREFLPGLDLDVADEIRALVKINLFALHGPVLGIAAGGVRKLAHLDQERGGGFGGDEVDAFPLAPGAVPDDPGRQLPGFVLQVRHDGAPSSTIRQSLNCSASICRIFSTLTA